MMTNSKHTEHSENFVMSINVESLCYALETNVILNINILSLKIN